jgi:GT2 family glycosyltransferase
VKLAILLVNYNSSLDLLAVIKQLEKEVKYPKNCQRKIYVLENGSPKAGEREALQNLKQSFRVPRFSDRLKLAHGRELFVSEKNLGFAGGNNFLLKKAKIDEPDLYLFLNPDTVVSPDFLKNLTNLTNLSNFGLASPKIYFAPGFETHPERYKKSEIGKVIWYEGGIIDWGNVAGHHKNVDEVDSSHQSLVTSHSPTDFCTGCCLLATKKVMEKLGGFDETYFLNWEDVDLSVRAQRAGFKTVYVPSSVIWHKNAVSKGGTGSKIEDFWQTRNRLIFAFKYAPLKTKLLLLWRLARTRDLNRWRAIGSAFFAILSRRGKGVE